MLLTTESFMQSIAYETLLCLGRIPASNINYSCHIIYSVGFFSTRTSKLSFVVDAKVVTQDSVPLKQPRIPAVQSEYKSPTLHTCTWNILVLYKIAEHCTCTTVLSILFT